MQRVLLIEDDTEGNNLLAEKLKKAGYSCTQAFSGTEGLFYLEHDPFSFMILEQDLSGLSSKEFMSRIPKYQNIPVLLISLKGTPVNKIKLTVSGSEISLSQLFEGQDLIDQIKRQIRHYSPDIFNPPRGILEYRELTLNTASYIATLNGQDLPLTKQEFKILELLVSYPDHIFTKQDLYDYAWDDFYTGDEKTINVHISNIRRKIKEFTGFNYVQTVWSKGFRLGK